MTEQLAVWSSRRPWLTLAGWVVALVAAIAITAAFVGDALSGDEEITSNTDSRRADELRSERFAGERTGPGVTEVIVVRSATATVDEPRFERRVQALAAEVSAAGAEQVTTFYDSGERRLVSGDRDATGMLVALGRDAEDDIEDVVDAVRAADGREGFDVTITGEHTLESDFDTLAGEDLRNGELGFGLPVALIVLLIVFGSVVAGLVPLLLAMISITVALGLLALVGQAFPLSVFATNMLTGMGLALGIDYSLFVLSRFREERLHGRERRDGDRRGRRHGQPRGAVQRDRVHAGHGRAAVGPEHDHAQPRRRCDRRRLVSVAAALTLLPALLSLLGDRVNALRLPVFGRAAEREESPFWSRAVGGVLRRPLISLVLATAILLVMAVPVLGLRSGEAGVSTLPDRLAAKQGYVALNAEFPGETTEPVEVVIDGDADAPAVQTGIERLRRRLAGEPRFGRAQVETNQAGDLTVLTVPDRRRSARPGGGRRRPRTAPRARPRRLPRSRRRGPRGRRHRGNHRRVRHHAPLASDRPGLRARASASCC